MDGLRGFRERLHDCFVRRFRRLGPVRLRGGHLALAQVRRGDEPPFSRLPLPPLPPPGGPADRGGLGLPARRGALLRARLVGRPRGRPPREARGGRQRGGSRAGAGARRSPAAPETPLFVFDAGYDPVRPQRGLEGRRAQILVRLHSGRTFYAEPEIPPKRPVGRPSRHGRRFSCKDPRTWPAPPPNTRRAPAITAPCASGLGRGCTPRREGPPNATAARAPQWSRARWCCPRIGGRFSCSCQSFRWVLCIVRMQATQSSA